jgi:CheY-like chemotaxis protein
MKVLIIDDDEAMIGIWSTVLKKESIEVLTAGSGKLGIELAQKNIPDFILLDQIITDMKGNDVLKQLKSNPITAPIPVALVSNYSEPEMMHEAIESGAVDYILKYQIDPSDLANKIKTLLHGTKPLNPGDPTQPQSMPADPSTILNPQSPPSSTPIPTTPQPQVINPQAGQLAPSDPTTTQPTPQTPPTIPQPIVIDPNKPTE